MKPGKPRKAGEAPLLKRLRELKAEMERLGPDGREPGSRTRLLVLKHEVEQLLGLLRKEHAALGDKLSGQFAASRAAAAYQQTNRLNSSDRER
ncbi:hypothetical protein [Roseibium sp. RKSG952]|uniref:hypothetical protein n=1 Tax=Roseibium sp. RKSG952 TaxID=2529384 RepID=UPI0012BB894E|nr:hypothetical protein [Roseibium sp. RKSG952]MTH97455.1 hypothetical protein [Roseibium sp. RKSG952]